MAKHTPEWMQVKARIIGAGWTYTEIADQLGCSRPYISMVVAGHKGRRATESPDAQQRIAKLVGIDPDDLFGPLCHPELRGLTHDGRQRNRRTA